MIASQLGPMIRQRMSKRSRVLVRVPNMCVKVLPVGSEENWGSVARGVGVRTQAVASERCVDGTHNNNTYNDPST